MKKHFKIITFLCSLLFCSMAFAGQIISPEPGGIDKANIINASDIKIMLADELKKNGVSENVSINIADYEKGIKLKGKSRQYFVDINNISVSKSNGRFKANISFKAGNNFKESIVINGTYDEMIKIPVFKSAMANKSIISDTDIEWMDIEKKRIHDTIITSDSDLIGKSLKRTIQAMSPIRDKDLAKETIVSRNQEVSILYKADFMTLRTSGVAIEAGGKGDLIKVRNKESNKIIDAVVQGSDIVVVSEQKADL